MQDVPDWRSAKTPSEAPQREFISIHRDEPPPLREVTASEKEAITSKQIEDDLKVAGFVAAPDELAEYTKQSMALSGVGTKDVVIKKMILDQARTKQANIIKPQEEQLQEQKTPQIKTLEERFTEFARKGKEQKAEEVKVEETAQVKKEEPDSPPKKPATSQKEVKKTRLILQKTKGKIKHLLEKFKSKKLKFKEVYVEIADVATPMAEITALISKIKTCATKGDSETLINLLKDLYSSKKKIQTIIDNTRAPLPGKVIGMFEDLVKDLDELIRKIAEENKNMIDLQRQIDEFSMQIEEKPATLSSDKCF
jgi:hypothetical protein